MSPISDDYSVSNLGEMITTERSPARPGVYSVNFLSTMASNTKYKSDNPPRCGSTAESFSEDDVDEEIINVTDDDDDVATATTDDNSKLNMLQVEVLFSEKIFAFDKM